MQHLNRLIKNLLCSLRRISFAPFALVAAVACNLASQTPHLLQLPTPTPPPAEAPTPSTQPGVAVGRPLDLSVKALLEQVQHERLIARVSTLAGMGSRHVLSAKDNPHRGIGAARDWLFGQFLALRAAYPDKAIQVWTQPVGFTWHGYDIVTENVVAVLPGTEVGAGVYVIGAHYDSISTPPFDGSAYAPGANDNGSGVAALLEIAEIMAGQTHRATLLFVAFTAEETGRQGSKAFVEHYVLAQNPPIDIRGMINLDMVGSERGPGLQVDSYTLRLFSAEPNDSISRQFARQLALVVSTYVDDVNLVLQSAEERTGRWGDHQPFSAAGYASVRLIQGLEDPTRQHNPRDTLENVQPDYLARSTRAALAAIAVLAGGPQPPADLALRAPDTLTWTPVLGASGYLVALRRATSLFYDQVLTVTGEHSLGWAGITQYTTAAIAAVDAAGRIGPLSAEVLIAPLPRR